MALLIGLFASAFWPGVPMYDTVTQYDEVISNEVDGTTHTLVHFHCLVRTSFLPPPDVRSPCCIGRPTIVFQRRRIPRETLPSETTML